MLVLKLHIVISSTRPGRVGLSVGTWFHEFAAQHGKFDTVLIDLAEINLPLLNEPEHPMRQSYRHDHTKAWSASVDAADAFVFVTPEYNFGPPPSLLNALNYVYVEWNYKPAGFVSYGGNSGGLRAVQIEKQILTTLKMAPIMEAVAIPTVAQHLDGSGKFKPNERHIASATTMLNELYRWTEALKPLRANMKST